MATVSHSYHTNATVNELEWLTATTPVAYFTNLEYSIEDIYCLFIDLKTCLINHHYMIENFVFHSSAGPLCTSDQIFVVVTLLIIIVIIIIIIILHSSRKGTFFQL